MNIDRAIIPCYTVFIQWVRCSVVFMAKTRTVMSFAASTKISKVFGIGTTMTLNMPVSTSANVSRSLVLVHGVMKKSIAIITVCTTQSFGMPFPTLTKIRRFTRDGFSPHSVQPVLGFVGGDIAGNDILDGGFWLKVNLPSSNSFREGFIQRKSGNPGFRIMCLSQHDWLLLWTFVRVGMLLTTGTHIRRVTQRSQINRILILQQGNLDIPVS